ncbi:hypothetical protein PspLS_10167 [Pyricularia sp. CBS 133598]|nr:hypothetical protein PspLS_10167 [Pyricularia sp. CBS 133598]
MDCLASLATELLLIIFAELSLRERVRLITTCRRLRHVGVYQARIFDALSVAWSSEKVDHYGYVVEKPSALPASLVTLLEALTETGALLLPCVESLVLEFHETYPENDHGGYGLCFYSGYCKGNIASAHNKANIDAVLPALMKSHYATSASPTIKSLTIFTLPPHRYPIFFSKNQHLRYLDLSLYGFTYDSIFTNNSVEIYIDFLKDLYEILLNHLPLVTRFSFHASSLVPIGLCGGGPEKRP